MSVWNKRHIFLTISALGLCSFAACGGGSGADPFSGLVTGGGTTTGIIPCISGQVCATGAEYGNVYQNCPAYNGTITTSTDGASVCRITGTFNQQAQGNYDYLGPGATTNTVSGEGVPLGALYYGDNVSISASGNWGSNTCHFNVCWGSSCSCTCSGGSTTADPNSGFYAQESGIPIPLQTANSFVVSAQQTELTVGFNTEQMTCFDFTVNVSIIRCIDANGETHPCQ